MSDTTRSRAAMVGVALTLLTMIASTVWMAAGASGRIETNAQSIRDHGQRISNVERSQEQARVENADRLGRIETKLDWLVEQMRRR